MPQAVLPQVYIDSTFNLPTGGTTWAAHTVAQLNAAISGSQPGDVIVLDAGVTYTGIFGGLPAKANPNNKWIYVISSDLASLPEGTRVSPASTSHMPKLVTSRANPVFQMNGGSNHWRFAGLEITAQTDYPAGCGVTGHPNCVEYFFIGTQSNTTPEPDSITVDRCYLHGYGAATGTCGGSGQPHCQDLQSAIAMNASNFAVVDSYISDIHTTGIDSQALVAYMTPGPIKIVNNYLEASTENILMGGGGGYNNPWVPSDIEIRNNYLFKPLAWVAASVTNKSMVVKNAFELKSAQRVLFDSNTIENVWANGQLGYALVFTVRSGQSGDIAVVNDVTVTNNVLKNVVSGLNSIGSDDTCGVAGGYPNCHNAGSQDRWYFANNLITFYDPSQLGGSRNAGFVLQAGVDRINSRLTAMRDVVIQHNTIVPRSTACWGSVYFGATNAPKPYVNLTNNIWVLDNALCRQPSGDNGYQGTSGLTQYMGSPSTPPYDLTQRFKGNVMYVPSADKVQSFPPHSYATTIPFTFINPSSGDYQLLTPYWTDTSDGNIAGVQFISLPASPGNPSGGGSGRTAP